VIGPLCGGQFRDDLALLTRVEHGAPEGHQNERTRT
jgi:hypothetical protein